MAKHQRPLRKKRKSKSNLDLESKPNFGIQEKEMNHTEERPPILLLNSLKTPTIDTEEMETT
jgi:hypothetical protein